MPSPGELLRSLKKQLALGQISQELYLELKAEFAEEANLEKMASSGMSSSSSGINLGDATVLRENTITSTTHNTKNEYYGPRELKVNVNGEPVYVTKKGERCPVCGKLAKDDYFQCRECGRDFICDRHQNKKSHLCEDCEHKRCRMEEVLKYYNLGNEWFEKKDYVSAIDCYCKVIELDPKHINAYIGRGNAFHEQENYDRAIEDFTKAIELDPKDAVAYNNRGNAFAKKDDDRAIEDYCMAIDLELGPEWSLPPKSKKVT